MDPAGIGPGHLEASSSDDTQPERLVEMSLEDHRQSKHERALPRPASPRFVKRPGWAGHRGASPGPFETRHAQASHLEAQHSEHEVLPSVQEFTNGVKVAGVDGGFDQDVHHDRA